MPAYCDQMGILPRSTGYLSNHADVRRLPRGYAPRNDCFGICTTQLGGLALLRIIEKTPTAIKLEAAQVPNGLDVFDALNRRNLMLQQCLQLLYIGHQVGT